MEFCRQIGAVSSRASSIDVEFIKGALGISCLCFMMSGCSSGKTPRLGVTSWLESSADSFACLEGLESLLELLVTASCDSWASLQQCGRVLRVSLPKVPGRSCITLYAVALEAI